MNIKATKKEKTIEKLVQIVCVAITIAGCLLFASCSTEDVCGNITGYDIDCNTAGPDCVYYLYIDGQKEAVTRDTWNQAYVGDYICIGY
tara:strand:+ start:209 stop:475 length:267 start_codon:yes stop_codon:yes gene_type:complete